MIVKNPDGSQGAGTLPTEVDEVNTGLLLYLPYRAMENRVFAAVAAAGFEDLTLALTGLTTHRPCWHQTDRPGRAGTGHQAGRRSPGRRTRACGSVTSTPDPTDNRARLVCIAAKGAAANEVASAVVAEVEAEWTTHVGARQMAQLRRTLKKLREITDPYQ